MGWRFFSEFKNNSPKHNLDMNKMNENVYTSAKPVPEDKSRRKKRSAVWLIAKIVFWVHLVPILLICGLVLASGWPNAPHSESGMAWILFFQLDSPLAWMLIPMIDGPTVGYWMLVAAGVPRSWWLIYEVIWPGVLFQIIGTLNWTAIVLLLYGIWRGLACVGRGFLRVAG